MDWITSDLHLGHKKFIVEGLRPFGSLEDMDNYFIDHINSKVKPNDRLFLLGDIAWKKPEEYRSRIRCENTVLILGNHDQRFPIERLTRTYGRVHDTFLINPGRSSPSKAIFMSHYAHLIWPLKHYGALHLFGHSHGKLINPTPGSFDVGVDNNNMKILSLEEAVSKARESLYEIPDIYFD